MTLYCRPVQAGGGAMESQAMTPSLSASERSTQTLCLVHVDMWLTIHETVSQFEFRLGARCRELPSSEFSKLSQLGDMRNEQP